MNQDDEFGRDGDDAQRVRAALRMSVPLETAENLRRRESRHSAAIKNAIANVPAIQRRERRMRSFQQALAAAAVALLAVGGWMTARSLSEPDAMSQRDRAGLGESVAKVRWASASDSSQLEFETDLQRAGDSLRPGVRTAEVEFPDGTTMIVGRGAVLDLEAVRPDLQRVRLTEGVLDVTVPAPDGKVRRVAVVTPDATVSVKGTAFRVEVSNSAGDSITDVSVSRGTVIVESPDGRDTLVAGDVWSSSKRSDAGHVPSSARDSSFLDDGGETQPPNDPVPVVEASLAKGEVNTKDGPGEGTKQETEETKSSNLAEQNRMLERAGAAERSGNSDLALRLLRDFGERYPDSPLLESAEIARRRIESRPKNSASRDEE